jgi:uncharacterized damage-inducible protein DinB
MNNAFTRIVLIAFLTCCAVVSATAQDAALARYVNHLKTSRDFTIKVAEQMKDSDYGFKLTPPQMSFAEQLMHLAETNVWLYSTIQNRKSPFAKPSNPTKANVIDYLTKSFDYSIGVLTKLSTGQLEKSYQAEGKAMQGWDIVMLSLNHTTHHRAQCEMYLRVKGITPAEYQF